MKTDPFQPFIGTFKLGLQNVDVYGLTKQDGGQFWLRPDDKHLPRIKVGFAYDYWSEVVGVLCHEATEYLAVQRGVRFRPCGQHPTASDTFRFHMDHNEFTVIMDDLGFFLAKCLPELSTAWSKHRKKK